VRAAVFEEAARSRSTRDVVLASVAQALGMRTAEVDAALFADLPSERFVTLPDPPWSPGELALRANLALVQGLIFRATGVTIEASGNARVLVRHARLRGLICTVAGRGQRDDAIVDLSGPFSLFRRTLLYGRALGDLVPLLAWCGRFRLRAECVLGERRVILPLATGDPIFPARAPRAYDSKLEERFAREFRRAARDWDVVREPEAVRAGTALLFPDFALQHRIHPERRWLLEIVGFWTPEYVARKLALYRRAGLANLILCIDEERRCAEADLPPAASVLRFRRRVDVDAVLRLIESQPPTGRRVPETFQT
jgi:predicted nuclease of restriction endonuclease-like RecB superfamily